MKKYRKKLIIIMIVVLAGYILISLFVPPLFIGAGKKKETIQLNQSGTERICLVDDNNDALLWRLRMIQEAETEIILTTFELRDDTSGRAVMAALLDAADRGVAVRVLIDGIDGDLRLHDSTGFKVLCSHENIQVKYYNPFRLTQLWKANYRLHDKYLMIDDAAYILGGRNTHDTYLGDFSDNQQFDREVVVYESKENEANSLYDLKDYFEVTWNLKDCRLLSENMNDEKYGKTRNEMKEHLESVADCYNGQLGKIDWNRETDPTNGVTLLTGDPKVGNKEPDIWKQMCGLMDNAEETVLLQTPLINCDKTQLSQESYERTEKAYRRR